MGKYIAVTIGPIFDTINLASTPSALWAASFMFSMLCRNICETLTENNVSEEDIISPYYSAEDPMLQRNDGVGLFHDRIIFRAEGFDIRDFSAIKETAVEKTVKLFFDDDFDEVLDYFKRYFLISAFSFESAAPIPDSSVALDSLELMKPFAEEKGNNPLLSLYTSDDEDRKNQRIKDRIRQLKLNAWQLYNTNRQVMSLGDIAANNTPASTAKAYKKFKYYAVIRSDGDRMGKIIEKLNSDDRIRAFSQTCLRYCAAVADAVKAYSGVTIYSGGDDLLALIPVENSSGETVFDFIKTTNTIFADTFTDFFKKNDMRDPGVSLSFGVFVSYYKFPLYEALEQSADLLFGTAKTHRDCTALRLQKHAGQSEGLVIRNGKDDLDTFIKLHEKCVKGKKNESSEILLSAMHKLAQFETMFDHAANADEIQNLFNNTFDADSHSGNSFLKTELPGFFGSLVSIADEGAGVHISPLIDRGVLTDNERRSLTMNYILRIIKFFTESGGEEV